MFTPLRPHPQAFKNQGIVLKARATAPGLGEEERRSAIDQAFAKYEASLQLQARIGEAMEMVKSLRGLAGLYEEEKR